MVQRLKGEQVPYVKRIRRVALYVRVSTDHQTIKNQDRELRAVADRHGWEIVATFKDEGVSGAKGRDERPGLDKLLQGRSPARIRSGRRVVASIVLADRWSTLSAGVAGVALQRRRFVSKSTGYRHDDAIWQSHVPDDGGVCRVRALDAQERVKAGLARARAEGIQLGRPAEIAGDAAKVKAMKAARRAGESIRTIAREFNVGVGTAQRLTA